MKITHRLDALLAACRKRRGLMALLALPLVFAGCATYNVKGAYMDAVEVGTAFPSSVAAATPANLPIYTKIAGTAFNLDILGGVYMTDNTSIQSSVSNTYVQGDSNIDLVDLAAPGCANACNGSVGDSCQLSGVTIGSPTTQPYGGGVGSFGSSYYKWTGAEKGRKTYFSFVVPKAAAKVKVRIYGKACYSGSCQADTMCSTDAFTVRPASFTVASTPAGGATQAAGVSYTMTATATNSAGTTTTGYTGTPVLTTTSMTDWRQTIQAGSYTGSFGAAVSGVSSGSFSYSDFGPLTIPAGAIKDSNYVANSGSGDMAGNDCISGSSSNTLSGGQYGCNIANQSSVTTPSFIAHHYSATHTITPACNSTFTYFGQAMSYGVTIDAFNALGNRMTRLTAGAPNKPTFTLSQLNSGGATNNPLSLPSPAWVSDATFGTASGGEYILAAGAVPTTRPAGLSSVSASPPSYESFRVRVTSSDANITSCNGVAAAGTTSCDSAATKLRYGVLKLSDGQGTAVSPAAMQITAQYWNGSAFVTNTDDVCTTLNFNAGTIAASTLPRPTAKNSSTTLSNGVGAVMLNASAAANVALKLGTLDNNCVLATSSVGTPLNTVSGYLGSASCSSSYDKDPSARMSFGTLRNAYIYRAEKF